MNEETKPPTTRDVVTEKDKGRCAPAPYYPSIAECVKVIAAKAGAPVNVVAAALLAQSQELGMSAEELVHTQHRTAMGMTDNSPILAP